MAEDITIYFFWKGEKMTITNVKHHLLLFDLDYEKI